MAINPVALALNFSYVLHAPSGSTQVQGFVAAAAREARRLGAASHHLAALDDSELRRRIWLRPPATATPVSNDGIIALQLGPWQLLPRALRAMSGIDLGPMQLLDANDPAELLTVDFFRGAASLARPTLNARRWWFASLLLRPGDASLLLWLAPLEPVPSGDIDSVVRAAIVPAEAALREFVLQWTPGRALWQRPAEAALPELAGSGEREGS